MQDSREWKDNPFPSRSGHLQCTRMPLSATYAPNGIFYNGSENNEDGTVTMTREFPIPFQRNRFCNSLGRLLGPGGQTVKWLRKETGCDIVVHTNDVRFFKVNSKVTIKAKDIPSKVNMRMNHAIALVLAIINPNDPGNTHMSDYQLFHPEDQQNANLAWIPSNFTSANSGPTPPENIAPGVVSPDSTGQSVSTAFNSQDVRSSSTGSHFSASSGSVRATTMPSVFSYRLAPSFPESLVSSMVNAYTQPASILRQPTGTILMNNVDPWFSLQMGYTPRQPAPSHHQPYGPNPMNSVDPWLSMQVAYTPSQNTQHQYPQRPFFHSEHLSRQYHF